MFDPEKFLDIAKKIVRERKIDNESRARTAISRSYHGAFLLSKKRLEEKLSVNFTKDNNEIHKQVIEKLKSTDSTLGDKLETLNEFRVDADLSLDREIEITDATHCIGIADVLKNQLKKI